VSDGVWIQGEAFTGGMCFGCGPDNAQGLRLRSESAGSGVMAEWTPSEHHSGGGGFICGGIIGSLLDCHSGAAVWWWVKQNHGRWPGSQLVDDPDGGPVYLTAGYEAKLLRPTPLRPLTLHAEVADHQEPEVTVRGHLESGGKRRAEIVARWRRFRPRG
jgi:acyl-coenzyme A thioesterase PaaI-like protein